jgi:hypothetical protein
LILDPPLDYFVRLFNYGRMHTNQSSIAHPGFDSVRYRRPGVQAIEARVSTQSSLLEGCIFSYLLLYPS